MKSKILALLVILFIVLSPIVIAQATETPQLEDITHSTNQVDSSFDIDDQMSIENLFIQLEGDVNIDEAMDYAASSSGTNTIVSPAAVPTP